MALIKCAECKKKVSTDVDTCPHCGAEKPSVKRAKCPKCKKSILFNADKCKHCGADDPFAASKTKCKKCGRKAHIMEKVCPHCGAKDPSVGWKTMAIGLALIIGSLVFLLKDSPEEREEERKLREMQNQQQVYDAAEKRRKGFHCLSSWGGSHRQFVKAVKDRLNDPDSFKHDTTHVSPVNNSRHNIILKFRAKNAFGGYVPGIARGSYSHYNCNEFRIDSIE